MLSQKARYALRAMVELARAVVDLEPGDLVARGQLARAGATPPVGSRA